jgi:hypothetical protein
MTLEGVILATEKKFLRIINYALIRINISLLLGDKIYVTLSERQKVNEHAGL